MPGAVVVVTAALQSPGDVPDTEVIAEPPVPRAAMPGTASAVAQVPAVCVSTIACGWPELSA